MFDRVHNFFKNCQSSGKPRMKSSCQFLSVLVTSEGFAKEAVHDHNLRDFMTNLAAEFCAL